MNPDPQPPAETDRPVAETVEARAAVWVAAYSNDVLGYIPTERVLREGGYEGLGATRLGSLHPGPWAPGLEGQIIAQVHELVQRIATRSPKNE